MVHLSRSEQKSRKARLIERKKDKRSIPYKRDKQEVEQYIKELNTGYANETK